MTAPTINGSAYPRTVDDLMPDARQVPVRDGEMVPSRRRLMVDLKIGSDKAGVIRDRLISEAEERAKTEAYRRLLAQEAEARTLRQITSGSDADADDTAPDPTDTPDPVGLAATPAVEQSEQVRVAVDADDTGPVSPLVERDGHPGTPPVDKPARRPVVWPVVLMALGAFVAVWSGWVGLGKLTGFGKVDLLPGIVDPGSWATIDSAITLPIGVEAYAAYALYVWLSGRVPTRARTFAKWSALASLAVGGLGQVAYHLLTAYEVTAAPWWITTLVSCLPVAVLGMGAALAHLVREDA